MNWDLTKLYKGFDENFEADIEKLSNLIDEYVTFLDNKSDDITYIEGYLTLNENILKLARNLFSFTSLTRSTDVNNKDALVYMARIQNITRKSTASNVLFTRYLKSVDLDDLRKKSKLIDNYYFNLYKQQESAKYLLSEAEEVMYSRLSELASSSWSQLQGLLTANLNIKYKGEDITLSEIRNLAYDKDINVRNEAFAIEIAAYKGIEDQIALALTNIKREVNVMNEIRGYESALDKTLIQSNMTKKTLDAMIGAMMNYREVFSEYLKAKAGYLGHENGLPFSDLFAPVGKIDKTYTFDEAKEIVLDSFGSYSNKLRDYANKAFINKWIDVAPKKGKVGGAFCSNLPQIGESRILLNFTGSLSDILTLAHELGHGYHGEVMKDNDPLHWSYPMPLAETASIFLETIMNNHLLNEFTSKEERLSILENSLQGDTQVIIDILSRYIFETNLLSKANRPISASEMKEMMISAQKDAYLDALSSNHPYMWINKGHYFSAGLNFYNFPYAFGLLFGKGLYALYLQDKASFINKYDELLKLTSKASIVDVAHAMDIDIESKEFFISSLEIIKKDILEVIELMK